MVERRGERECNTGIGLDEEEGRLLWSEGLVLGLGEWWWGVEEQEGLGGVTMEEEPRITSSRIADTPRPQPLFLVGLSFGLYGLLEILYIFLYIFALVFVLEPEGLVFDDLLLLR